MEFQGGELMKEALTLIDQLIEEHKVILQRAQTVERIVNDLDAISEMHKAKEDFVPGRLGDQKQGLQSLQESLKTIDNGLQAHFDREERGLLTVFEEHGGGMLAAALHILLLEHKEIKDRIAESKEEVDELASGKLSREVGEGKAWGMRVYISHTLKLLGVHTESEEELFQKLRAELVGRKRE